MGSTHVSFKGNGFEANDSALEVWLALLVKQIDGMKDRPDWLRAVREEWYLQATAGFDFGVMPELDRFITSDEKLKTILPLADRAIQELEGYGPLISRNQLNAFGTGGTGAEFTRDLPASELIRPARYFIKLLKGELEPWESDSRFETRPSGPSTNDLTTPTFEAVSNLASLTEPTRDSLKSLEAEWKPDLPPVTVAMGIIAKTFARHVEKIPQSQIESMLNLAERLLLEGNQDTKDAVATGFFEALLAESSDGRFDFRKIVPMLGIQSRQYCVAWDQFTGVTTEGLSESGDQHET